MLWNLAAWFGPSLLRLVILLKSQIISSLFQTLFCMMLSQSTTKASKIFCHCRKNDDCSKYQQQALPKKSQKHLF